MNPLTTDEISTLDLLAYNHLKYGQAKQACAYLKFLINLCPDSARIHRSYAMSLLSTNSLEEALKYANISLELAKDSLDRAASQIILCLTYHKLNRTAEAQASSEQFILERQNTNQPL